MIFWYDLVDNATSPTLGHHSTLTYFLFKPVPAYMTNDFGFSSPIYRRHIDVLSWLFGKITLAHFGSGDFMHAETGGIAGALIPPANYSGSGLGKSDLGHLARENASVMNMVGPVVSVHFLIYFVYFFLVFVAFLCATLQANQRVMRFAHLHHPYSRWLPGIPVMAGVCIKYKCIIGPEGVSNKNVVLVPKLSCITSVVAGRPPKWFRMF